ncbi:MAG TPA: ATP-binding cassette domain-containing protein, partial [Pseudomonadales bacterium]|nr:ATP-binding cassette domain-containing protein [Pseudomonadales bacterium]
MSVIVECRNLVKDYQQGETVVEALRGVSVSFEKGEFVSISGPSGSGKSTLLHIIGSLEQPTSGEVLVDGISLSSESKRELADMRLNRIGFVFQAYNLL